MEPVTLVCTQCQQPTNVDESQAKGYNKNNPFICNNCKQHTVSEENAEDVIAERASLNLEAPAPTDENIPILNQKNVEVEQPKLVGSFTFSLTCSRCGRAMTENERRYPADRTPIAVNTTNWICTLCYGADELEKLKAKHEAVDNELSRYDDGGGVGVLAPMIVIGVIFGVLFLGISGLFDGGGDEVIPSTEMADISASCAGDQILVMVIGDGTWTCGYDAGYPVPPPQRTGIKTEVNSFVLYFQDLDCKQLYNYYVMHKEDPTGEDSYFGLARGEFNKRGCENQISRDLP